MLRKVKKHWKIILIIFLASVLRLYKLGDYPQSLTWDETALGYNAYSILKTARDEYGTFLPIVFKSFGDFKPGLYVYLAVPFVAVFDLSELAVRLPSALVGVATIIALYYLLRDLFPRSIVPVVSSLILAINPWHLEFSRGAWEANVSVFLSVLGVLLFFKSTKSPSFLFLSALSFGLTFITYQGAKVFTPLLALGLLAFYSDKLKDVPLKIKVASVIIVFVIALPLLTGFATGRESGRAKVMSLSSYTRSSDSIKEIYAQDGKNGKDLEFYLFHSEALNYARGVATRYFNHFSGKFLLFEGDWSNKRLGVPYMGVIYLVDILFLVVGLFWAMNRKQLFLFYWLFISPLPAAITRDIISSVRALNMVVPLSILIGIGIAATIDKISQRRKASFVFYFLLILAYGTNLIYFLDQYFIHAPIHNSSTSQDGYREVINATLPLRKDDTKVIFTQSYGQPYIYWLFYSKYDPSKYQKQNHMVDDSFGDVGKVASLDQIEFREIYWPKDRELKKTLYVGNEFDLPYKDITETPGVKIVKEVLFKDGKLAFRVVVTD